MKTTAVILVVEDESIIAQDLQIILENLGYDVPETTDSGESAIQKAAEINPDLILMDIRLIGEIDGIAAAKAITERFDIPIIYITAHSDAATLARAKITNPFGYIIKPFKERELSSTIEIALYKHQVEKRLKENEQWLATVLESIGDGVIVTDKKGRVTFINPVAEALTGWSFRDAVGKDSQLIFRIINEITRNIVSNPITTALDTGEIVTLAKQTLLVSKDGREIPIEDNVAPLIDHQRSDPVTGAVLVFRDITQQKITAERLYRQAYYDALTNLPNRIWFRERLTDALERVKRNPNYLFALLFLDLDRFKALNDSLGHLMGDRTLIAVAERLLESIRLIDTVSRLGGDEFAILLEGIHNLDEACRVAERILAKLSASFNLDGNELFINTSIGIVLSSIGYENVEELIRDADIAMYRAKARGRGCYEVFDTEMRDRVLEISQLENSLRQAIERNELVVYYQPIFSVLERRIVGFEGLVRWNHPQNGLIYPAQFIPIAEETGLIIQIDMLVLRTACLQMKTWQQEYQVSSPLTVCVNLSSRNFVNHNFLKQVRKILEETGFEPKCLKLEITESILIENPEATAVILIELKAMGILIALDDFGTGYSSLNYLQRFPFDILKIDKCFVRNVHKNLKNSTISKALIEIAHQLNLKVIAEGVETQAELDFLVENRCDEIQGYLLGVPLPPTEFVREIPQYFC